MPRSGFSALHGVNPNLKKTNRLGKKAVLLQKQKKGAAKLSLPLWNSKLLVPIGGRADKIFCTNQILLEKNS